MSNKEILNWWDSMPIIENVKLREKYGVRDKQVMDVDDYRFIYESETII